MLDLGLVAAAKQAVAAKPRHYVTPAMVLAVCNQESHLMPYFVDIKPGSTYALNVNDAIAHKVRDPNTGKVLRIDRTGMKEADIRNLITIPATIDGWQVPKAMVGQKAKFRFEPSYWAKYHYIPDQAFRFRLSCSWGLPQFMGANICNGKTGEEADLLIQRFAADVPMQLLYCAGFLDELLTSSHGSLEAAYRGYNSGNINSTNPAVVARAKAVQAVFQQFDDILRSMK